MNERLTEMKPYRLLMPAVQSRVIVTTSFLGRALASVFVTTMFAVSGCGVPDNTYVPPPPPTVRVVRPIVQDVNLSLEQNGETEASERAEIRARVRGFVKEILFEPGQSVDAGMPLYRIEDDEYRADVQAATAEVAAAEAAISVAKSQVLVAKAEADRAERELQRQSALKGQQATSQTEYDLALASNESARALLAAASSKVESATAMLQQSNARLDRAKLDLAYTTVTAPIAGRVTKTDIKLGNLVDVGTELAAVVDDSRVYVNFSISDRELLELRNSQAGSQAGRVSRDVWQKVPVRVKRESDEDFRWLGTLNYVDQEGVDVSTGTLPLRAVFDNPQGALLAGLFVRVRLPVALVQDAKLIPARALMTDRSGSYVLVVDSSDKVERRDVSSLDPVADWVAIKDGIEADDRVIVDGSQRARLGLQVQPVEETLKTDAIPAAWMTPNEALPKEAPPAASSTTEPAPNESEAK